MISLGEFKRKLLETGIFRKANGEGQYKCDSCPYCGDMKKHMYVLIKQSDDTPVLYHCFKCTKSGVMDETFLSYYGIELEIPKMKGIKRIRPGNMNGVVQNLELFHMERDVDMIGIARDYILKRVGVMCSLDDLKSFRVIGNPFEYARDYLGGDYKGLKGRIWFGLTNGNMIGRSMNDDGKYDRWKKYNGRQNEKGMYMIKNQIDSFNTIYVCIAEGVMDCIGLYYHGGIDNGMYLGCLGRDYVSAIKHVIDMGIFGDSVCVRIYKDSDVDFVKIPNIYRKLFKSIDVYQNAIGKDYGVHGQCIQIEKCV